MVDQQEHKSQELAQLQDIYSCMKQAINEVNDESEQVVLVCGNTGAGKSTLINYLVGYNLEAVKKPNNKQYYISSKEKLPTEIGLDQHTSMTSKPIKVKDEQNKIAYFDCPGFEDSRGLKRDIINSFYINKLINSTNKKIKILLLIEESSFSETKGRSFKEVLGKLQNMFENQEDKLINSLIIIFTKADNIQDYQKEIQQILQKSESLNIAQKNIVQAINQKSNFAVFSAPNQEGIIPQENKQAIIKKLGQIEYEQNFKAKLDLSNVSKIEIQKMIQYIISYEISEKSQFLFDKLFEINKQQISKEKLKNVFECLKNCSNELNQEVNQSSRIIEIVLRNANNNNFILNCVNTREIQNQRNRIFQELDKLSNDILDQFLMRLLNDQEKTKIMTQINNIFINNIKQYQLKMNLLEKQMESNKLILYVKLLGISVIGVGYLAFHLHRNMQNQISQMSKLFQDQTAQLQIKFETQMKVNEQYFQEKLNDTDVQILKQEELIKSKDHLISENAQKFQQSLQKQKIELEQSLQKSKQQQEKQHKEEMEKLAQSQKLVMDQQLKVQADKMTGFQQKYNDLQSKKDQEINQLKIQYQQSIAKIEEQIKQAQIQTDLQAQQMKQQQEHSNQRMQKSNELINKLSNDLNFKTANQQQQIVNYQTQISKFEQDLEQKTQQLQNKYDDHLKQIIKDRDALIDKLGGGVGGKEPVEDKTVNHIVVDGATGAAIGSLVPGVGTVVGAAIGGICGAIRSWW